MKARWLGHACFLLTSDSGLRIVTDPYTPGAYGLDYGPPSVEADIVTVSHEHDDHNNVKVLKGRPEVVRGPGSHQVKGVRFKGVATYHDEKRGQQRGPNTVFCFPLDGVSVCHLGDLGHELGDREAGEIGPVDVLLIPVGGNFTIDADAARRNCEKLAPKVVIPMHFQNERCPNFPVARVEGFVRQCSRVKTLDASEVELKKDQLPAETETIVLRPAL